MPLLNNYFNSIGLLSSSLNCALKLAAKSAIKTSIRGIKMFRFLLGFTLCSISFISADGGDPKNEIRQALVKWSQDFNDKNVPAVCSLFAPDLVAQYPSVPDRNYSEMCRHFKEVLSDPSKKYSYSPPQIHSMLVDGNLAVVRLVWVLKTPTETIAENGLDVFRRQQDGSWKISISYAYPLQ